MRRVDVLSRVLDEIEVIWPGDQAETPASLDDVDRLFMVIDAAIDDCRGVIESSDPTTGEEIRDGRRDPRADRSAQ